MFTRRITVIAISFLLIITSKISAEHNSIKELDEIAYNIEQSIMNLNGTYFNSLFDRQEFLSKVIIDSKNTQIINYNLGFSSGFYRSFDLGNMLVSIVQKNGTFEYLKSYEKNNTPVILFRSFSNEGLNYHEFHMKKKDDKYVITDVYVFLSGELLSENLKRTYYSNLFKILPEHAHLYADKSNYKTYKLLEKAQDYTNKGKYKKAFDIWSKIPAEDKSEKKVQLQGIQIASSYNTDVFSKLCNTYNATFPNDPGYYLFSLNGLYDQDAYYQSLICVDSLDHVIGTDPMLDFIRAEIYVQMGKEDETILAYNRLINSMPEFEAGYLELFEFYINKEKYQDALGVLDKMSNELDYYKEDFSEFLKNYPSLINTETYSQWMTE